MGPQLLVREATIPRCDEGTVDAEDVETLIYLDVDGVLNIGIRDPGDSSLLLNETNLAHVKKMADSLDLYPAGVRDNVERMLATMERVLPHGDTSYADFACSGELEVSGELVRRLATIIRAAGARAQVVLASTWRLPKYVQRMEKLEAVMSEHLNQPFRFDQRTRLCAEHGARDRLRTIGDHMAKLGTGRDRSLPLNVVVLDDFCITGFEEGQMDINGERIRSPEAAASYLRRRYAPRTSEDVPMSCIVVHTYDEWHARGHKIQVGSGLTMECVCEATRFLGQACNRCLYRDEKCTATPESADEILSSDEDTMFGYLGSAESR